MISQMYLKTHFNEEILRDITISNSNMKKFYSLRLAISKYVLILMYLLTNLLIPAVPESAEATTWSQPSQYSSNQGQNGWTYEYWDGPAGNIWTTETTRVVGV